MEWVWDSRYTTLCVLVFVMIVADFVTGTVAAVINHTLSSSAGRLGLYHKMAELVLVGLAYALEQGSDSIGLTNLPIMTAVCVYVVWEELTSVLENIKTINPELADNPLFRLLADHSNNVTQLSQTGVATQETTKEVRQ